MLEKEQSVQIDGNTFYYIVEEDFAVITGANRLGGFVTVPEYLAGANVGAIGKKAFLGQNALRQITLPKTVTRVMEWSFAQCRNLEKVIFLADAGELAIEKGAFGLDEKLRDICIGQAEETDASCLLACATNRLLAEYLLTDRLRGTKDWYGKWDKRLCDFLSEDDEDGYSKLALCGEEDIMLDVSQFMEKKRQQKAGLCLLRLMHDSHLTMPMKAVFEKYILSHTKGCESQEAWDVLLQDFISDISYVKLFADLGGITEDNIEEALCDLGADFAEAKGFLLSYKESHFAKKDVFAGFAL